MGAGYYPVPGPRHAQLGDWTGRGGPLGWPASPARMPREGRKGWDWTVTRQERIARAYAAARQQARAALAAGDRDAAAWLQAEARRLARAVAEGTAA